MESVFLNNSVTVFEMFEIFSAGGQPARLAAQVMVPPAGAVSNNDEGTGVAAAASDANSLVL